MGLLLILTTRRFIVEDIANQEPSKVRLTPGTSVSAWATNHLSPA